ncbi:type IV secretion system DNA-binding domain-containing protein [Patescibacteria group bacterium]|nr:type IV secretion system DNA-binding domain-containing protein [Patescibacteria group bacterium]
MSVQQILIIAYLVLAALVAAFIIVLMRHWLRKHRYSSEYLPRLKSSVFFEIQVPKDMPENEQASDPEHQRQLVAVAEQIFTTLSEAGYKTGLFKSTSEYMSFEIATVDKKISFYINCPQSIKDLVEKQVHAQYPAAQIEEIKGYNPFSKGAAQASAELTLQRRYVYPIRTYKIMESDPLNAITSAMSKLDSDEGAVLQMIIRPAGSSWQEKPRHMAMEIQQGKNPQFVEHGIVYRTVHDLFFRPRKANQASNRMPDLSGADRPISLTPMQQEIVKRLEEKASRPGYKANLRVITSSSNPQSAELHMRNILSSIMQFSMPPFNGFSVKKRNNKQIVLDYIFRAFNDYGRNTILNTEELASIWHLPTPFIETPNIKWLLSKKAPAPVNMPQQGLLLGNNVFRGVQTPVRIQRDDRRRHVYIIGRTGSGKSELIKNMAIQDIQNGEGLCVVDPHGDLVEGILPHIPKQRAEDVILFEPFDVERPMGLNILEVRSEEQKDFAVQEMISIFYKLVTDPAMLGPMFEHNMRNAMLTLMADEEHPGTIVDIPRIFTDTEFQKYKVSKVRDLVVRNFWEKEMAKTSDFHKSEMLGYLISKVGRFVENSMMRNIVGQSKSGFDFREVMDTGKILLINLAKGRTGEINSKLLGLIIVSKLQMAALSRTDIPEENRKDFYLYVDEFQNFITDAFSTILSEARKYRLNLNIAHQYLGQLEQAAGAQGAGSKDLRDAVFGNAGTEICFRIGVEDAEIMAKEFAPVFSDFDLVNIDRFNAYVKLMINGTASKPFNMATLPPMAGGSAEMANAVRQMSRLKYGRPKEEVEAEILEASKVAEMLSAGPAAIEKGL